MQRSHVQPILLYNLWELLYKVIYGFSLEVYQDRHCKMSPLANMCPTFLISGLKYLDAGVFVSLNQKDIFNLLDFFFTPKAHPGCRVSSLL